MNFSSYINGESVRNQDLVNWVTVGTFDVPTSESAPVTSINGRSLSFWLLPYNYFDQVRASLIGLHATPHNMKLAMYDAAHLSAVCLCVTDLAVHMGAGEVIFVPQIASLAQMGIDLISQASGLYHCIIPTCHRENQLVTLSSLMCMTSCGALP